MKLSGGQLAGGNSISEKADNDFYTTNPKTVKLFLEKFLGDGNKFEGDVWECACGSGNISEVLKKEFPNCNIISSDLVDHGYGVVGVDFLKSDKKS